MSRRLSLCENRHERFKRRLLDQRQRIGWRDPLNHALLELGPELALSCHEQGKDWEGSIWHDGSLAPAAGT
jgi:hypothetical protein